MNAFERLTLILGVLILTHVVFKIDLRDGQDRKRETRREWEFR